MNSYKLRKLLIGFMLKSLTLLVLVAIVVTSVRCYAADINDDILSFLRSRSTAETVTQGDVDIFKLFANQVFGEKN